MILNAVLCVYNEEDIIESTVRHLFAQGCTNVFLVDNASTDATVEIAVGAGAVLADSFESSNFNEYEKIAHLNTVVRKSNAQSQEEYTWWIYVDADEFPNVHGGTIISFLHALNPTVRAVHGYMFEHVPTHPPYYSKGYHPVDFMPLCRKSEISKIPLLRYDKNKEHLYSAGGAHTFDTCGESVVLAKDVLAIHHFNYRKPENTLSRLKGLVAKKTDGTSRMDWFTKRAQIQKNSLHAESMYHTRYRAAQSVYLENKDTILMVDTLPYSYKNIVRWYDERSLSVEDNSLLNQCMHQYYLKEYKKAFDLFNSLLEKTDDKKMQTLIIIKIAMCLAHTDKQRALRLLEPLCNSAYSACLDYAKTCYAFIENNEATKEECLDSSISFELVTYSSHFEHKIFV